MTAHDGQAWRRAQIIAALVAGLPGQLGGVRVVGAYGPAWERWQSLLRDWRGKQDWRQMNPYTSLDHLLGSVDVIATLASGRRLLHRGILEQGRDDPLMIRGCERLHAAQVTAICHAMDQPASSLDIIACTDDWQIASQLEDRIPLLINLDPVSWEIWDAPLFKQAHIKTLLERYKSLTLTNSQYALICDAAAGLGIQSARRLILIARLARGLAALFEAEDVTADDVSNALSLACTTELNALSAMSQPQPEHLSEADAPPESGQQDAEPAEQNQADADGAALDFDENTAMLLAAQSVGSLSLAPPHQQGRRSVMRRGRLGKAGQAVWSLERGRRAGSLARRLDAQTVLDFHATVRAAIPQQPFRRRLRGQRSRLVFRADDVRVRRFRQKTATATIFVVDASGSAALERLGEAKGAVEQLLAECYVRRDEVALIAFRGADAEVLLPPTRSLVRAKRTLVALAGGGGTPLAKGIALATELADQVEHRGFAPYVVLLTDARANVSLHGLGGREQAFADALLVAKLLQARGWPGLLLDTSVRGVSQAQDLATHLGANYLPLPYGGGAAIRDVVLNQQAALH